MDSREMFDALTGKNTALGCDCYNLLMERSERSPEIYDQYWDALFALLTHPNAYARIRAFGLIVRNARWDREDRLDEAALCSHIFDAKPIVTRKHIELLPELCEHKPGLRSLVRETLRTADVSAYADSMRPLIEKDRDAALNLIGA